MSTGVSRGTVLRPLFFILYIHDIFDFVHKNVLISFADDTAVVPTCKEWRKLENNLNFYLRT